MVRRIVLLGPPGAGKGTHAKMLSDRYGIPHIATGDLLRSQIEEGTPLGKRAQSFIDGGKLVPDELVIEIMKDQLQSGKVERGFILDGFPRTAEQASALDDMLRKRKMPINLAFQFDTSEEVIVDRLSGRRACLTCGANYHIRNIPPRQEGICDICGSSLTQRKDDDPKTVRERLEVYERQTAPLMEFYKERKVLRVVNGDLEIKPLQKELAKRIESL